jgi:hypothetical protein
MQPAFGLTYGRPEASIETVAGAPAIKSATLTVTVDYEMYWRAPPVSIG